MPALTDRDITVFNHCWWMVYELRWGQGIRNKWITLQFLWKIYIKPCEIDSPVELIGGVEGSYKYFAILQACDIVDQKSNKTLYKKTENE